MTALVRCSKLSSFYNQAKAEANRETRSWPKRHLGAENDATGMNSFRKEQHR
jgi:hypothetical protein